MADDKASLSLNQFALYLVSDAGKRRKIIEKRKEPQTFAVIYYELAQSKISDFIMGKCKNEEILIAEIDRLYALTPKSDYEENRNKSNAEALECFLDVYPELNLDSLKPVKGNNFSPRIEIAGVEISIRPEIVLSGIHNGYKTKGAIKLYFSKDTQLDKDSGSYISALLNQYLVDNSRGIEKFHSRHCQVIDVFGKNVFCAPVSVKRRMGVIATACEEIKLWWGVI